MSITVNETKQGHHKHLRRVSKPFFPGSSPTPASHLPFNMNKAIDLRSKCGHFRILILGRANAGKTTILKKVCNSIDGPEIFSPSGEKVIKSASEPKQSAKRDRS